MLSLKLAWRNIWRNRRRTVITTLSIVVAVFLSAVTRSTQEGQYENMVENTVGTFTGHIQLHANGYWDEPNLENSFQKNDTLLSSIKNQPGILEVVPRIQSYALAAGDQQSRPAMIIGIDIEAEKELSRPRARLQNGSYFTSNDQQSAIIGKELFNRLNIQLGDSLVLFGQGFRGMTATGLYEVVGVVSYPSPEMNSSLVYLPMETAQQFLVAPGRLTTAALVISDPDPQKINRTIRNIRKNVSSEEYEVMSWQEMMPELVQAIQADRGSGIIILLVLYMVVGFGILGTVLMMISERSYEFGVMLSIGTPRATLAKILSAEILFMTMLGTAAGILLSIPVIGYFYANPIPLTGDMSSVLEEYGMEPVLTFSMDPSIFMSQAAIVFFITLLFCLIPLLKAVKLTPVEAMKR